MTVVLSLQAQSPPGLHGEPGPEVRRHHLKCFYEGQNGPRRKRIRRKEEIITRERQRWALAERVTRDPHQKPQLPGVHLDIRVTSQPTRCPLKGSAYLLFGKVILHQGAHDLLRGLGSTQVGSNRVSQHPLSVSDPAWGGESTRSAAASSGVHTDCPPRPALHSSGSGLGVLKV